LPNVIYRHAGGENRKSNQRIAGIAINCIANHACAHDTEKACCPGMSWDAKVGASSSVFAAQNEQAACGGTEEEEIHGGYVIQNLVIPSGKKDYHRPDTL